MQLDMGNQLVEVDGFLVQRDALRVAEAIKDYDPNLEILCLDPARAESITDEPFIVAERCADGKLRPVLRAMELNDLVLQRVIAADKCTLGTLEEMENRIKAGIQSRYQDVKEETADVVQHILQDRRSSYTVRDSNTGELLTFYDDRPATRKQSVMDVDTFFRLAKRQYGDEYDVVVNDDDIYGWCYDGETEIIRHTGSNTTILNTTVGSFPVSIPDMVNIKRMMINGKALTPMSVEELDLLGISNVQAGVPTHFYRQDRQLYVYPQEVGSATAVVIHYNKVPVLMAGTTVGKQFTIPEVYHNDLLHFVIARAHNKNQNHASERVEMEMFEKSVGIRAEEADATTEGPQYKLIDPMDWSDY